VALICINVWPEVARIERVQRRVSAAWQTLQVSGARVKCRVLESDNVAWLGLSNGVLDLHLIFH